MSSPVMLVKQQVLCIAAVALVKHIEAGAQRLLEGAQVLANFALQVADLVD